MSSTTTAVCPHCHLHRGHRANCPTQARADGDYSLAAYREFLKHKTELSEDWGFPIEPGEIHPWLKPHQRAAVQWAVRGGRRALFESFGLGKSVQQLEILRLVLARAGGRGLIVAPLGVRQEFRRDAEKVGIDLRFIRSIAEAAADGIYLTNYETVRDGKLDPAQFTAASLDEASVLRSFGGTKTFREFMRLFDAVKYRFVATATPDPNEYIELLAYAAFLGIMDVSQAKTRFFKRDSTKADKLTLHGHKTQEFWLWVSSWALFLSKPSDICRCECHREKSYKVSDSAGLLSNVGTPNGAHGSANATAEILTSPDRAISYRDASSVADACGQSTEEREHELTQSGKQCSPGAPTQETRIGKITAGGESRSASVGENSSIFSQTWENLQPRQRSSELKTTGLTNQETATGQTAELRPGIPGAQSISPIKAEHSPLQHGLKNSERTTGYSTAGTNLDGPRTGSLETYCEQCRCDEGYALPELEVIYHQVTVDHAGATPERDGQGRMFREATHGVIDAAREKRDTLPQRIERMVAIVQGPGEERRLLQAVLRDPQGGVCRAGAETPEKPRVLQELLSGPQRTIQETRAGTVPEESRASERTQPGVAPGEPGTLPRSTAPAFREEPGKNHRAQRGMVPAEQGESEHNCQKEQAASLRNNPRNIRFDAPETEGSLCDLQMPNDPAGLAMQDGDGSRSQSSERQGAGVVVPDVQHGIGTIYGQRSDTQQSACLPEQFIVWCDLNQEQRCVEKALSGLGITYSSISGSDPEEIREETLEQWRNGETTAFIAKPVMYGAGVNLQQCHEAIFLGIGFKFSEFFQAIKRIHRFLQTEQVRIHLIYAESEKTILANLLEKWERHKKQQAALSEIVRQYGLSQAAMSAALSRSIGTERLESSGAAYTLVNNDCVEEIHAESPTAMPSDSVHLILTSIPFSTQYEYSPSYNDFGCTDGNDHFFEQMDFLTPQLLRVLKPGRIAAIHVKDRIVPGGITGLGFQTVYPFHAECIRHFTRHGFAYMGMKTIVTDVVRENNQTYRLGWTEQCKDGTKMGVGMPEYLLLFRKPPTDTINSYADEPVVKSKEKYSRSRWQIDAHGFMRSSGNRPLTPADLDGLRHDAIFKRFREYSLSNVYDFERHVKLGEALEAKGILPVTFMLLQPQSWHPDVWTDITRMRTLNGAQSAKGKEMQGETVLDPFGGLGTVAMTAVQLGRRGYSVELNTAYWLDSITYCRAAEEKKAAPTLFDLEGEMAEVRG